LSFEILNAESTGWNLNTINFTGSNPGSTPGFSRRPIYVDPANNAFRPPQFTPNFPTGSDSLYAITLTTGGYSEFKMTANQVSKFRYGYEFFSWGYQGMSMAFGDPPAVMDSVVPEKCFRSGGSIYLKPAGLGPYTFSWSNGSVQQNLINVPAGTYSATITDVNGCSSSTTKTIEPGPVFSVQLSQTLVDTLTLITSELEGGKPPFTYFWNTADTTDSLLVNRNGTFTLIVTDSTNCQTKDSITVDRYVGNKPFISKNLAVLKLWPNPAKEVVEIELSPIENWEKILIINTIGRLEREILIHKNLERSFINLTGLSKGIYMVRAISQSHIWQSKLEVR
jgi:hypothetical protein